MSRTRNEILEEARNSNVDTEILKALSIYHMEQLMMSVMRYHKEMGQPRDDKLYARLQESHRLNQEKYNDIDDLYNQNEANIKSIIDILKNNQQYSSEIDAYFRGLDNNKVQNSELARTMFQRIFPNINTKSTLHKTPTPTNMHAQIDTPSVPTHTAQSNAPTGTPTNTAQNNVPTETPTNTAQSNTPTAPTTNRRKGREILNEVIMNPADPAYDKGLELHHLDRLIKNMIDAIDKNDLSKKPLRQALKTIKTNLEVGLLEYDDINELLSSKSEDIKNAIRLLNQKDYSNDINDYLKSLNENKKAITILQKSLPRASENSAYKSGSEIIKETIKSDELNDDKIKALQITYSLDWIKYIQDKIPTTDPDHSALNELYTKLNEILSGNTRHYLTVEDAWIDCQSILNNSKEILNHPKYADHFETYKKSQKYNDALAANNVSEAQMSGILNQVRPPTSLGEILFKAKRPVDTTRPDYQQQFTDSIKAINDFNAYRNRTKKHVIRDLINRSHRDKKSKSAKMSRSNEYTLLLKELVSEEFTRVVLVSGNESIKAEPGVLILQKTNKGEIWVHTTSEARVLTTGEKAHLADITFPENDKRTELKRNTTDDAKIDQIISACGYTKTNELKRLKALQELTQSTHDNINKSGKRSRFKRVLVENIQPMLNDFKKDLEAKNSNSELHVQTLQILKEMDYANPRKEFAYHLRQYIDTVNMAAMPNMKYIENANRLFTHLLSPKKKDELTIYLEGIYNDIMSGKINSKYFDEAQTLLGEKWKNNPQAIKILVDLKRDFETIAIKADNNCGFTNIPSNNYRPAPPTEQNLQEKKDYLEHSISRSFYFLNMAHGIGSTGMFAENKRGYGQAADFIASIDTSALNAVAPGVSLLQSGIVFGLNKMDEAERNNERSNSTAIKYDQIDAIGKALARLLTDRFSYQLESMYFSPTYTQTLDTLADYAVRYTLTNLKDVPGYASRLQKSNGPADIANVLLDSMLAPTFKINTPSVIPLNPLRAKLDHIQDTGIFQKKMDWTVDGLFQKSGYVVVSKTGDLTFYKPEGANIEKYGYAFVSEAQAEQIKRNCKQDTQIKESTINKYKQAIPESLKRSPEPQNETETKSAHV